MPAKSGVSGAIIAVLPGRFGIAVQSPLLDSSGNSVRGIEVCRELSRNFGLHVFGDEGPGALAAEKRRLGHAEVRARTTARAITSRGFSARPNRSSAPGGSTGAQTHSLTSLAGPGVPPVQWQR